MRYTGVLLFLPYLVVVAALSEPQCSPFHYQEQMLEKMIDVKYKLEKWETAISDKMDKIDESMRKQEMLETRMSEWMLQQQMLINQSLQELDDFVREKTEVIDNIGQKQKGLEQRIEDGLTRQPVYFKARNVKNRSPAGGDTLVFDTIVQSEGEGYNPDTGVFTAQHSGTYMFSVQLCLYSGKYIGLNIIADKKVITAATFGDQDYSYMCTLTDGIASLSKDEEVKVVVTQRSSTPVIYDDNEERHWSYFSGVFLHK